MIDCVNLQKMTSPEDASADDLVMKYNRTLTRVVDELAPEKTKVYRDKPRAPWFTDQIRDARTELRRTEQNWRNHPLEINRQIFVAKRLEYSQLLDDARADYHRSKIENSDQTKLFLVIDELIGEKKSSSKILPDHHESMKLAESFKESFCDKINIQGIVL